jgi:hypothetical protein
MSPSKKYNFIVKYDQFGRSVNSDYYDISESVLIEQFEKYVNDLKNTNKEKYSMIELGANQAYYSLLFSAILGNKNCINIMVEPQDQIVRGMEQFYINEYVGTFIKKAVANNFEMRNRTTRVDFDVGVISFDEIFKSTNIEYCDVLHCDIDGHELKLLIDESEFLQSKKFKYAFICTHSINIHNSCRDLMLKYGYKLLYEIDPQMPGYIPEIHGVGTDSLLIFSS